MNMPHLDAQKVFGLFTEAEARRAKRLIREKKSGPLRTMIVRAMQRAENMPLANFVGHRRERITLRTVPGGMLSQPASAAPAMPAPETQREG